VACWNFAEAVYRLGEGATASRPALIHDGRTIDYRELRRRTSGIARYFQAQSLPEGAHVGHYMRNSNAYMETFLAAGLVGLSHVNVNYRYQDEELIDLCNGLDLQVLVYDADFAERVARIRPRLQKTTLFICAEASGVDAPRVDSPGVDSPGADAQLGKLYDYNPEGLQCRTSSDDLVLIATGGTTGLPKGVQWRHEDIWRKQNVSTGVAMQPLMIDEQPPSMGEHIQNVARLPQAAPFLCLSPLMHGAGFLMAIMLLAQGVAVATLGGERFDADATIQAISDQGIGMLVLVGDAFAMPLVEALDKREDEQLLASLKMMVSSGASLSNGCRDALLRHQPALIVFDSLGSTETSGYAVCTPEAGVFQPQPTTRVLDEDLQDIEPGSGDIGIVYAGGYLPQGYYNSPEKTAETFVTIDGKRYVCTGDRCTVREDGMLELLGRDSTVVNTGGEKVYTVEVERVLLEHPDIDDVVVVGLPHPRFGKQVAAVVQLSGKLGGALDPKSLQDYARERLADYKVPRQVFAIEAMHRAPNGKPDYPYVQEFAQSCLEAQAYC
jgi:3-oxocholest-4-en-26-oate---CoA ligase